VTDLNEKLGLSKNKFAQKMEVSDSSFSDTAQSEHVFGVDSDKAEGIKRKTKPEKGYYYLFGCIFMIIVLSIMVVFDHGQKNEKHL